MTETAEKLLTAHLDDAHLSVFAARLVAWLEEDLVESPTGAYSFTESRAKAILRAMAVVDDPTLHDFMKLIAAPTAMRLALFDLLNSSGLAENEEVAALAATSNAAQVGETPPAVPWLALAVAAQAWKSGYPLHQLDPASPPGTFSPAGQLVKRAATFLAAANSTQRHRP